MSEVKELLHQMLQMAILRKEVEEAGAQSSPCPSWMQERNACSPFPFFSGVGTQNRNAGIAASSLELSPDDNVNLNKESDPTDGEATGRGQDSVTRVQSVPQSDLLTRNQRREGSHSRHPAAGQPGRESRVLSRILGKAILNRPIRVDFSRGTNRSGKRALDCIRKCIIEGGLHPVQCHSIC